jgi:tetratricopeptide (TPR) repeat protein
MAIDPQTGKPKMVQNLTQSSYAIDTLAPSIREEDDHEVMELLHKANGCIEKENFHEGEILLRQALERAPNHPECMAHLAICLAAGQRRYITAENLAKQVIQKHPYSAEGYYALGQVNLHGSRRKGAFRYFGKANRLILDDYQMEARLKTADPRKPPVIKALPRNHPLNIQLGKWRAWFRRGHHLRICVAAVAVVLAVILVVIFS